jgi:pyrroline-5-carboxylate reductase
MICMPSVARHEGVCLHCSPTDNPNLTSLFNALGGVVTCKTEDQLAAAMMTTCVMGPMYGIMRQGRDWLIEKGGFSPEVASYLVSKQYLAMVQDANHHCDNPSRLDDLINEQTPGGVNAQALANVEKLGGLDAYGQTMDAILSRIRGDSDGSA